MRHPRPRSGLRAHLGTHPPGSLVQRWVHRWRSAIGDDACGELWKTIVMVTRGSTIAVHIMANRKNGALYTGVTSDLKSRIYQHRETPKGFVKQWGCTRLVWYEVHDWIEGAIGREKSIKSCRRQNKINLIENLNPDWRDLYYDLQC